jgi:beta-mannosidase
VFIVSCTSHEFNAQGFQPNDLSVRQIIPLSGTWKFRASNLAADNFSASNIDDGKWFDIKVPANWYLEGHDISGVAWYRKRFYIPETFNGKQVSLKFDGIDYKASIWLNGHYIGFHEGYFQPFVLNVTDAAVFGKENVLTVKVDSPLENASTDKDWSLHKRLIKGIFSHHDTRPDGAWSDRGQEHNTGGIWAAVNLEIHDVARVENVQVSPKLDINHNQATANVAFQVTLKQRTDLPTKVRLTLRPDNFPSANGASKQIEQTLVSGDNQLNIPITISNPQLWWPWEHGAANLYSLEIAVLDGDKVVDSKRVTFGFREISYDKDKKIWLINGKRLFLRGTNYIATQWLSEMTAARFAEDVALMKNANVNIVRIHAHVTAEDFYRLCDEQGLLIWQDFPLQWGYADDEELHDNALRQAKEMVSIFYNHPSIAVWSLINEPAWDSPWMQYKYPSYKKDHNKKLTEDLYQAIEPLDKTRHVHAYSATIEHPWLGWYAGVWQDYNKPARNDIITEYGAQALPNLPSLRKIFNEDELWPVTEKQWEKWKYHNFQPKETFEIAKVPMGNTITEFIANTQNYQAKVIKLAAESYRRQRYNPVNSIFQFMFVEDWPSMNWGVVDYWRTPKSGYYALQQAYQPVLPSIAWEKEHFNKGEPAQFKLWVINDLFKSFPKARLLYNLRNSSVLLESKALTIDIAADSGQLIQSLEWKNLPSGHYEIVAKIEDSSGKPLGINTHAFDIKP